MERIKNIERLTELSCEHLDTKSLFKEYVLEAFDDNVNQNLDADDEYCNVIDEAWHIIENGGLSDLYLDYSKLFEDVEFEGEIWGRGYLMGRLKRLEEALS